MTNADLEKLVATSDEWIRERTGIRERRIAAEGQACSDLGLIAAERALKAAGISADELDMILLATCTGDMPLPSTACLLQHRLGATRAAACDVLPPAADSSTRLVWPMPIFEPVCGIFWS